MKWNDVNFNPSTEVLLTEGQYEFLEPIPLNHTTVSHLVSATPKKCENKLNEMHLILKRQMQNWERSGQGEGCCDENDEEDEFFLSASHELGSLDNRPHRALLTHANFFKYSNMYLLYFWDMIEKYQLRKSCLQMLDDKVAAKDEVTMCLLILIMTLMTNHSNR